LRQEDEDEEDFAGGPDGRLDSAHGHHTQGAGADALEYQSADSEMTLADLTSLCRRLGASEDELLACSGVLWRSEDFDGMCLSVCVSLSSAPALCAEGSSSFSFFGGSH